MKQIYISHALSAKNLITYIHTVHKKKIAFHVTVREQTVRASVRLFSCK